MMRKLKRYATRFDGSKLTMTRGVVQHIGRVCNYLYHQAVSDAFNADDAGLIGDFLERFSEPGVFGTLESRRPMDYNRWQLYILRLARERSMWASMNDFFVLCGKWKANYLSVFMPVAQEFYLKGLRDVIEYGFPDMVLFEQKPHAWLCKKGFRNVPTEEFIQEVQEMCYQLDERDEAWREDHVGNKPEIRKTLNHWHYMTFEQSMRLLRLSRINGW